MALINCPECGKEISDSSGVCIHCGYVLENKVISPKRDKKSNKYVILAGIVVTIVILCAVGILVYERVIVPKHNYENAVETLESGDYDSAILLFTGMIDYKDSAEKVLEANYRKGMELLESENYEEAIVAFKAAQEYQDAILQVNKLEVILEEQKKQAEAEAMHQALVDKLAKAYNSCIGGQATLSSDGTELIIDGKNQYDILSVSDIQNVCSTLELPETLFEEMSRTNSLMGKQTQNSKGYQISWSYHPNNGLDVYFKVVD